MQTERRINVLVVDDSAVMRQILLRLLDTQPDMEGEAAADPLFARRKMSRRRPDVMILDLEMPRMDGLTFLREIMENDPLPVIICSALTGDGTGMGFKALELGAAAIVTKPQLGLAEFLHESAQRFFTAIREAATTTPRARRPLRDIGASRSTLSGASAVPLLTRTTDKIVAIAASTGGTEAIREILEALPADSPPIVIVQHMPEGFTAAFAQRLDGLCRLHVREAEDGERLTAGKALIAPGNRHLEVVRSGAHYLARLHDGPPVSRHRPSADVLFSSVARSAGQNAVGVILTGMGDDGAAGLGAMREAGARTIAQDEASCVVYGMPKAAIACGAAADVVTLEHVAEHVLRWAPTSCPTAGRGQTR